MTTLGGARTGWGAGARFWLATAVLPAASDAQETPSLEVPAASISVSLLTMGPGDAIWEVWGHNALRIRDPSTGTDVAYNWGMFDFASQDFIPRLVKGTMLYWMAGYDGPATLAAYAERGRDVWAQELNLTPEQKTELVRYLRATDTEENRFYPYDYYLDNCSTRVRDALDRVLGGRVRATLDTVAAGVTWRWHARRILRDDVPAYVGMELALGSPADRPVTAWDEGFLPLLLMDHLRDVQVADASGGLAPLVLEEVQLVEGTRPPTGTEPPFWLPWFVAVGVGLGLMVAGAGRVALSGGRRWALRAGALLAAVWSLVAGCAGLLLLLAWLLTDHTFWYKNENLLQTSPLSLLLLPAFAAGLLRGTLPRWSTWPAAGVLALSLAGLLLQVLPGFDQMNGEIIGCALPLHAGVAWLAQRLGREGAAPWGP